MKELPEITNIVFNPVTKTDSSFIGYIGFTLDNWFIFCECSLHESKYKKGVYRVVYPENKFRRAYMRPKTKEIQEHIDKEISTYINVQMKHK